MTSHVVRNSLTYWKIVDIFKKTSLSDIVGLATTSNFSFAVAPPPPTPTLAAPPCRHNCLYDVSSSAVDRLGLLSLGIRQIYR